MVQVKQLAFIKYIFEHHQVAILERLSTRAKARVKKLQVTYIFQFLAQARTIKQASTYPDLVLILRSNKESKLVAVDVLRDHLVSCLIRLVGLG